MNFDNNVISSILITHQARIKCYLNNFINSKIHRFMNGCILKITRHTDSRQAITSENDKIQWVESIELIYNGMIDEAKPDYIFYQINGPEEPTDSNEGKYKIIDFPELSRNLPLSETKNYDSNSVYEFYVIRHGQAEHNIKENWGFSKQLSSRNRDTNLTSSSDNKMDGEKQAIETGKNLYDYLVKEKEQEVQTKLQTMVDENNSQQNTLQTGLFRNQQTVQQGRVERELHGLKQKDDGSYEQKEVILNIENIFVSDLKRTRQTLQNILLGMFNRNKILKILFDFIKFRSKLFSL